MYVCLWPVTSWIWGVTFTVRVAGVFGTLVIDVHGGCSGVARGVIE